MAAFEAGPYPCWEFLDCEGEVPQSRSGHTCALYKNRYLYIFGGFDGSSCFDDLYVLDLDTRVWRKIEAGGDRPSGRASHSAVTDEMAGVMYVFGGSGSHFGYTNKCDLCEFCFETECWRLLSNPTEGRMNQSRSWEETPSARYGQSMVAYQQGLYVWGGTHGTNYPTDMYRFELCSKQWEHVATSGDLPCGRYRHQAMVKDDLMYIVGGSGINRYGDVFTFHFPTSAWRKIICTGTDLSDGRYAHSAVLRDGFIFLYGGNDTVRHDDLQQLDLETKVWSRVVVHGSCPPGRDFHAAVLRKDSMVIFGGSNGMRRHNDVFEFHMEPKIPLCTLGADLEAILEQAQMDEAYQWSCDLFLAAEDSDWVHGVYCHKHLLLVRCPLLFSLVQERSQAIATLASQSTEGAGHGEHAQLPPGVEDNLDSLLQVVNGEESSSSGVRRALPRKPPAGWSSSMGPQSRCAWVPMDMPHQIMYHFVNFLYSETTKFGQLSTEQLYRLFLTAKQWEVPRLAALCERQIKIRLNLDNVLPLLRASMLEGVRAQSIQDACKHFFLANYEACTELRECEALDPRLLCELMRLHNSRASIGGSGPMSGGASLQPLPQMSQQPLPLPPQPLLPQVQVGAQQPLVQNQQLSPGQLPASPSQRSAVQAPAAVQAQSSSPHLVRPQGEASDTGLFAKVPSRSSGSLSGQACIPPEMLAEDLKRLLVEEISPDFEVVVQDEVIRVHKFLLVARSRYFASCILTSGMVESQAGRLVIPATSAMTADAFRALLRFLYAGDDILGILEPHTAMYLVDASSFYGLSNLRLKNFCELCVKDSFNETHVLQLFEASSRLDVEGTQAVRAMALDFIISNFNTVCRQPSLEQLDKHLLIEIMRGVAEKLHQPPTPMSPGVAPLG